MLFNCFLFFFFSLIPYPWFSKGLGSLQGRSCSAWGPTGSQGRYWWCALLPGSF